MTILPAFPVALPLADSVRAIVEIEVLIVLTLVAMLIALAAAVLFVAWHRAKGHHPSRTDYLDSHLDRHAHRRQRCPDSLSRRRDRPHQMGFHRRHFYALSRHRAIRRKTSPESRLAVHRHRHVGYRRRCLQSKA